VLRDDAKDKEDSGEDAPCNPSNSKSSGVQNPSDEEKIAHISPRTFQEWNSRSTKRDGSESLDQVTDSNFIKFPMDRKPQFIFIRITIPTQKRNIIKRIECKQAIDETETTEVQKINVQLTAILGEVLDYLAYRN
jgi:hypothetical protein